jgi:hypothetical protein
MEEDRWSILELHQSPDLPRKSELVLGVIAR